MEFGRSDFPELGVRFTALSRLHIAKGRRPEPSSMSGGRSTSAFLSVQNQVLQHLTGAEELPLDVTGHSLGGALATLASWHFAGDQLAACYAFGAGPAGCDPQQEASRQREPERAQAAPGCATRSGRGRDRRVPHCRPGRRCSGSLRNGPRPPLTVPGVPAGIPGRPASGTGAARPTDTAGPTFLWEQRGRWSPLARAIWPRNRRASFRGELIWSYDGWNSQRSVL